MRFFVFCTLFASACGVVQIDILQNGNNSYAVSIKNIEYSCIPKTPPLSHSWSYECEDPHHLPPPK